MQKHALAENLGIIWVLKITSIPPLAEIAIFVAKTRLLLLGPESQAGRGSGGAKVVIVIAAARWTGCPVPAFGFQVVENTSIALFPPLCESTLGFELAGTFLV
jgi:hypothetical protein